MSSTKLKNAAEQWLHEHGDTIEFFDRVLPFECVPEDEENPKEWACEFGQEADGAIGYRLQPVESETGECGVALIFGKGHSWEGIRLMVEGVYETEEEALRSIDAWSYRI